MKTILKLSIVFITALISNSKTKFGKEFCHSFENNGFEVDFTFQYMPINQWSLNIGSHLWLIRLNTPTVNSTLYFDDSFRVNESQIRYFGGGYRLAFSFENSHVYIGLWKKNERLIDWFENKNPKGSTLMNITSLNPSFSVPILFGDNYTFCFGEQKPSEEKYKRRYECFQFMANQSHISLYNESEFVETKLKEEDKKIKPPIHIPTTLNDISGKFKIIGMFAFKSKPKDLVTLVYKMGRALYYCTTYNIYFTKECDPSGNILIDCKNTTVGTGSSIYKTPGLSTDWTPSHEFTITLSTKTSTDHNYLKWIVVSVVVIVVILVILVISLCLMKSKKTTKVTLIKSSKDNKPPKDAPTDGKPKSPPKPPKDPSTLSRKKKTKKSSPANKARQQLETKGSETFIVQKDVDYSKPIPLDPNKSVGNDGSTESFRPTDLNVKPN